MSEEEPTFVVEAPKWSWLVRVLLSAAVLMAVLALTLSTVFQSVAVRNLAAERVEEQERDACYNRFSAGVAEGNAAVLSTLADLVVVVAAPERNATLVASTIARLDRATDDYDTALTARAAYTAEHFPLPCPIEPGG